MTTAVSQAWLVMPGVDQGHWSYQLSAAAHVVGRARTCQVRLLDGTVSRRHAFIWWQDFGWRIQDLGSRNGSFVNGVRVNDANFATGDWLQFGQVRIEVVAEPMSGLSDITNVPTSSGLEIYSPTIPSASPATLVAGLSTGQQEVFEQLVTGLTEKEIAAKLHLSRHTVHAHIKGIYRELGVRSRAQLLARYAQHGLANKPAANGGRNGNPHSPNGPP